MVTGCASASAAHSRAAPVAAPAAGADHPLSFAPLSEGDVHALVPKQWTAQPLPVGDTFREGLTASPDPDRWAAMDGSVPGLEVAYVDVARGGIPSNLYYLAASGPAIPQLASSSTCKATHRVIVDHRPAFGRGAFSPGDYAERGNGMCRSERASTRWAYFVAAPGLGPLRDMGIPTSGLYVVVVVVPEGRDAAKRLRTLLLGAEFGKTSVSELIVAARRSAQRL